MVANTKVKRKTQKRCWKRFTKEDLHKVADLVTWRFGGQATGCKMEIHLRTMQLEDNIKYCIEMVAPMRIVTEREGKPLWITEEHLEARQEREKKRHISRRTKHPDDFVVWKLLRNKVNRDLNNARKKYREKGLNDKLCKTSQGCDKVFRVERCRKPQHSYILQDEAKKGRGCTPNRNIRAALHSRKRYTYHQ